MRHGQYPILDVSPSRYDQLRAMAYADYVTSPEWYARVDSKLQELDGSCQVCNGSLAVNQHVHHRTYERRGNEWWADLTVLCLDCHALFHRNSRLAVHSGHPDPPV